MQAAGVSIHARARRHARPVRREGNGRNRIVSIHARARRHARLTLHTLRSANGCFNPRACPKARATHRMSDLGLSLQFQSTRVPEGTRDYRRSARMRRRYGFNPRACPKARATPLPRSSDLPNLVSIHARARRHARPLLRCHAGWLARFQSTRVPEGTRDPVAPQLHPDPEVSIHARARRHARHRTAATDLP